MEKYLEEKGKLLQQKLTDLRVEQLGFIKDYLEKYNNVWMIGREDIDTDDMLLTDSGVNAVTDDCEVISASPYMNAEDYYLIGMYLHKVGMLENIYIIATKYDDVCAVEEFRIEDIVTDEYGKLINLVLNGKPLNS